MIVWWVAVDYCDIIVMTLIAGPGTIPWTMDQGMEQGQALGHLVLAKLGRVHGMSGKYTFATFATIKNINRSRWVESRLRLNSEWPKIQNILIKRGHFIEILAIINWCF